MGVAGHNFRASACWTMQSKAHGQHVLQQQGYQKFFGKCHHDFIDKQDLFYENTKMHIVFILI